MDRVSHRVEAPRSFARGWLLLFSFGLGLVPAQPTRAEDDDSTVMFAFDDHSIPWHHNTQVTLVQADKHPANPVVRRGPPGAPDHGHAILYGTVLHQGGKFRMWYLGMIERELKAGQAPGWWRPMCYAESDDGIHFREPVPDFKIIPHGRAGEWDQISLLQGHAFANVGDKTYIWYSHWDSEEKFRHMEIGLATLRRDGFGYLSRKVDGQDAHCVTANVPARVPGCRLAVNVDGATAKTPLVVELLDKLGRPLPNYSGAKAARVSESGVRCDVAWPAGAQLSSPKGEPFAVQVRFPPTGDVRLYAIYATPACGD